jgi:hypothetical protein
MLSRLYLDDSRSDSWSEVEKRLIPLATEVRTFSILLQSDSDNFCNADARHLASLAVFRIFWIFFIIGIQILGSYPDFRDLVPGPGPSHLSVIVNKLSF